MKNGYFPDEVVEAETICALRFKGYEFLEAINRDRAREDQLEFQDVIKPVVSRLELHADHNLNYAAFFGLQRFLHKWGGEYLTKFSDEHVAYDILFLSLYREEPPAEFTEPEYARQWEARFRADAEKHAAFVRKSFRRKGRESRPSGR